MGRGLLAFPYHPSGLAKLRNHYHFRISESIQERQHQLLSATNSDPVRTRTCDAPSVPASRHPQFAMPMSKPVLLRAQNNKHASMVEPTVTQQKLQQPRRLEKELAFGEVQWTQVKFPADLNGKMSEQKMSEQNLS